MRPTRDEGSPLISLVLARGIVSSLILFGVYRPLGRTVERSRQVVFEPVLAALEATVHTGPGQPTPRDPMDVCPVACRHFEVSVAWTVWAFLPPLGIIH